MAIRSKSAGLLVGACLVCVGLLPSGAVAQPGASTRILSGSSDLLEPLPTPVGDSHSRRESLSGDGRLVVFSSDSSGLDDESVEGVRNVYVKDLQSGAVELASRRTGPAGEPTEDRCDEAAISSNGRFVSFTCDGSLDPADDNERSDVYLRDLVEDTTILVSRGDGAGPVGNGDSHRSDVADNGRVTFESTASNLITNMPAAGRQVYLRFPSQQNLLISKSNVTGMPGNGESKKPSISDLGTRVAFESIAGDLVTGDNNQVSDVFMYNVEAGEGVLLSRGDGAGPIGNRPSYNPAISGDGTSVAFESESRFDPMSDPDELTDVYRRSVSFSTTALVSVLADGTTGSGEQTEPSISQDGDRVAFLSDSEGLDAEDPGDGKDAYVKDLNSNEMRVVSRAGDGSVIDRPAASVATDASGQRFAITYPSGNLEIGGSFGLSTVVVRDEASVPGRTFVASRPPGDVPFENLGGSTEGGSISADGSKVAFETSAPGLGAGPDGSIIAVRDTETGEVEIASRESGATGALIGERNHSAKISADGNRVVFVNSSASEPLSLMAPSSRILVRDMRTDTTIPVNLSTNGEPANGDSLDPAISADGGRVAFTSRATNLDPADDDTETDVYLRDLAEAKTILVSRADGPDGPKANLFALGAELSGDGETVGFASVADNLDPADADTASDVFLRDVTAETTRLVSTRTGGEPILSEVSLGGISSDAGRVLLDLEASDGSRQAYVKDVDSGEVELASRLDGANGAMVPGGIRSAAFSADGRVVAFTPISSALPVLVRQMDERRTLPVGIKDGPGGEVALDSSQSGLNQNGTCVTFTANGFQGAFQQFRQVFMRTLVRDCGNPETPGGKDRVPPVVSRLKATPRKVRLRGRGRKGTVVTFRISERSRVTVTVGRLVPGRKTARGCVAKSRPVRKRKCRAVRRVFRLVRQVRPGPVRIKVPVRVRNRKLKPGTHRITVTAKDPAGNRSKPRSTRIAVRAKK